MEFRRQVTFLSVCVAALAVVATLTGIFSSRGPGEYQFTSLYGQALTIYGRGVYGGNTTSAVLQAIPQDIVTLVLAVPLLLGALWSARRGSLRGRLLLAGTLAYFLISYSMYTFIAMYNRLFLVYVALMSTSFFAFLLTFWSFDPAALKARFSDRLPVRFIGRYLMTLSVITALLWLRRVVPSLIAGTVPLEVEHGTTLPVQAIDLAFVLPSVFLAGWLLVRKVPLGYLLAPILAVASALIMAALFGKGVSMNLGGIAGTVPIMVMAGIFFLLSLASSALLLRNLDEGS